MNTISSSSAPSELVSNNKRMVKAECIETERNALLDIKRGLAGGTFSNLSSWGSSQAQKNCCAWSGVRCDHNTGHVTQLNLSQRQNFYTKYPNSVSALNISSLLHLRNLDYLDLSWNTFSDPNLSSIGSLTNLEHLDLSNADIQGVFLDELGNLSKLSYLDLSSIELSSRVPKFIASFTSLTYLDLSHNYLFGAIPDEFGNLTKLHHLGLSNNNLQGNIPNSISVMTGMTHLNLSANSFEGVLPSSFQNLSRLQIVDFSYNNLSGTFQDVLYLLPEASLQKLWISDNQLTGSLPDITRFSFLDQLKVRSNLLNGYLPKKFEHKSVLRLLDLSNNHLQGRIPMSLGYIKSLETLILRNNSLDGELPESLRNCTKLGFVDLSFNNLSGSVPSWIGQDLWLLYALVLKSNKLNGSMPNGLCYLLSLRFLDLSINKISGKLPQCLSNLTSMISNGTGIIDHFYKPHDESPCTGVTQCEPSTLPTFSYLDDALASWKGKEQPYKRNFAYLKMIDLSSNGLTGEIPIGITELLGLNGLNLSMNKLYGKVPVQIGGLSNLEVLDLSSNKFSGAIPESLSKITFLSYLNLSSNNFSGKIPLGSQLQSFHSSMYEGNAGLCGLPLTERCPGDDETSVKPEPQSNGNEVDDDENVYERWLYVSVALGFSTSFWGICGTLLVHRRWRNVYFLFLTKRKDQLYVVIAVRIARLKVRFLG
ncbi:hypothetical protein AgCh_023752 [Apium graveolens]